MSSAEFLRRHQNDELAETLDMIDWIGELRLLERRREKGTTLKELRFADRGVLSAATDNCRQRADRADQQNHLRQPGSFEGYIRGELY